MFEEKIINVALLNCCKPEAKCEQCSPEWTRRCYVTVHKDVADKESLTDINKYTAWFPMLSLNDAVKDIIGQGIAQIMICSNSGVWYVSEHGVDTLLDGTDETKQRMVKLIADIKKFSYDKIVAAFEGMEAEEKAKEQPKPADKPKKHKKHK